MNARDKQIFINEGLRYFQELQRKTINTIPVETNQTPEHFKKICEICFEYALCDCVFLVNAKLKSGRRPDITLLWPERKHIEVMCSEKIESITDKRIDYPFDIDTVEI